MATDGFGGKARAWSPEFTREAAPPVAWVMVLVLLVIEAIGVVALAWLFG